MFSLEGSQRCFHSTKFNFIIFRGKSSVCGEERKRATTQLYCTYSVRTVNRRKEAVEKQMLLWLLFQTKKGPLLLPIPTFPFPFSPVGMRERRCLLSHTSQEILSALLPFSKVTKRGIFLLPRERIVRHCSRELHRGSLRRCQRRHREVRLGQGGGEQVILAQGQLQVKRHQQSWKL